MRSRRRAIASRPVTAARRSGADHQPFPPGGEPHHLGAAGTPAAGPCRRCRSARVHAGRVHQAGPAASRSASPEPHGHQANATGGSSSDSGVASSGRAGSQPATTERRPGRADRADGDLLDAAAPGRRPPRCGRRRGGETAGRQESQACPGVAAQRQGDEPVADRGQHHPHAAARSAPGPPGPAGHRGDAHRGHRRGRLPRPEQLLHGHAERLAEGERHPQRGIGVPDSTAETACLLTPAMPASCCCENPRVCRASRSPVPVVPGPSTMPTDRRRIRRAGRDPGPLEPPAALARHGRGASSGQPTWLPMR